MDGRRLQLLQMIGGAVARFQEASYAFDDVAAEILALSRHDLPVMTALLFDGAATADELAATLPIRRPVVSAILERLQLAGYARVQSGSTARVELTAHARSWIERIWAPLREGGAQLLDGYSIRDLAVIARFTEQATAVQEAQTTALHRWLAQPVGRARQAHLRGGLPPATLKRVQVFVEANLGGAIPLRALADRAGLSLFHALGAPILLGASRKRIIGSITGKRDPKERLPGSLAVALAGAAQAVQILRVHDVEATRQALDVWRAAALGNGG